MTQGRSIRLFLVDGSPNGLLTAEIMNWTGHVLTGPRSKLPELIQRPECNRTGIYFLIGVDPENSLRPLVYIGETDDVAERLKQHNAPEKPDGSGGKDFWERVCLITSKDQNLTKAHVKYLESRLIKQAKQAARSTLTNATAHDYSNLPESDQADMAFFLAQIQIILPVLGIDWLREPHLPAKATHPTATPAPILSPRFITKIPRVGIKAHAQEVEGDFFVLAGSLARAEWTGIAGGYQDLHQQLCHEGILEPYALGLRRFTKDYAFASPSAAAAVVSGRSTNGREQWKLESTGQSYATWQNQQLNPSPAALAE